MAQALLPYRGMNTKPTTKEATMNMDCPRCGGSAKPIPSNLDRYWWRCVGSCGKDFKIVYRPIPTATAGR